jgi:hypothetical protein
MHKILIFSLLMISFVVACNAACEKKWGSDCGEDCTGTPGCGKHDCGNVDDMCYCNCESSTLMTCQPTAKGWKWNSGIKKADGSYALNGTKGDNKYYRCS